jgi:hypothetical protein
LFQNVEPKFFVNADREFFKNLKDVKDLKLKMKFGGGCVGACMAWWVAEFLLYVFHTAVNKEAMGTKT